MLKSRNKIIAATIVVLIAVGALYFFSGFFSGKSGSKPQNTAAQKIYKLTFGHSMPPNSAIDLSARKFAEVVSQKTNGGVTITIYPNQELANDHKMIEMAVEGDLDILLTPTAKMGAVLPALQYSDIPFLFPHKDDAYEMLAGEPGRLLLQQLNGFGLIGAAFWGSGFKQFTAHKEIHSPKDFKGMNVRIMKSPLIMDQFREFGANPIPIDFHETYKALKDGVVEAEENPIVVIYDMKFHEVQSHITISNHAYLSYVFSFSKKNFEKLPPDIQQILMATSKELAGYERELIDAQEADVLKKLAETGIKITYLTDDEIKQFQLATTGILYKYAPVIGGDVIASTLEYLRRKYKYEAGDDIIIGLNADMTLGASMSGMAIERGMKIAAKEINESGGLLGKKLIVVTMDHAGNTARSNDNIKLFAKIKNLAAVMGGLHSHIVMGDLKLIHLFKIPYLLPWTTHPQVVQNGYEPNYVFRLSANDTYAGPFLVEQALKRTKKIALLRVNTGWGDINEEIMANYLKEKGLKFTAIESFNLGETDFHEQIERIAGSGAGIIIMLAYNNEGAIIIKHLFYGKKKIPVISHMAITGEDFYKEVKKELTTIDLSFMQTYSFITANNTRSKDFVKTYMNEYGVKTPQEIFSPNATARAYDMLMLLAEAVRQAGTLDKAAIRDAMESIQHYEGLTKMHSPPFTKTRHDALDEKGYFMAVFDKNGAIIPIGEGRK
ncbi:MAG: DctP family TRAP transporter solute-binding subunit [Nitrospirae bacterium]|nr:DctP family TRAP transporter solute-binding subunit [Nitrospirota bacterium]